MELLPADWERLRQLRAAFLHAPAPWTEDTWTCRRDLELYEHSFARRISWKWNAVLRELAARGFPRRPRVVLDWGCGTAVASRSWLEHFGAEGLERLHATDRSPAATSFAAERLAPLAPGVELRSDLPAECDLLLVSHVLGELDLGGREALRAAIEHARCVVWIEPGTRERSRELLEEREALRTRFEIVAPCPQRGACGLLAPGHEADWCHHFAAVPRAIFQDSFWSHFSRELGIDLRSLPYAFLALAPPGSPVSPPDLVRVLGRPRVEKGRVRLDVCAADGVHERALLERHDRARFDELSEAPQRARLYRPELHEGRLRGLQPWP